MPKREAKTDLWVYDLLKESAIDLEPQGSSIKEISEALKSASKRGSGRVGFPEYVGIVKDFLIVIENKADISFHLKRDSDELVSQGIQDVTNYAVNGALFYGTHLARNTSFKKVLAIGVSGCEKRHRISPLFIDDTERYIELPDVESFVLFSEDNIDEFYVREILKEKTDDEKDLVEILADAAELHEDLRNYGSLKDIDKPLIVSGILLALREAESRGFSIDDLVGDQVNTDGKKIFDAIENNLRRSSVTPDVKRDKILSQFSIIKETRVLNTVSGSLGKTPLRHFTEFLNNRIYKSIRYTKSSEDYLGRFYGEFMSYSGGDGQSLGIVLTPKHIADLFCELIDLTPEDVVLDPCTGTGSYLVASMHHMLSLSDDEDQRKNIRQKQLHGFELQPYMFTIATTNMILRGDGKSNLVNTDFLGESAAKIQLKGSTVGMMNPPYSQGSKRNPNLYEMSFTEHLLDSIVAGGRVVIIVPQSSMTGKTREEKVIKASILSKHTLEGVITLNKDTFYGVGTMPCIAVFTAGEPHQKNKLSKFIDFSDDGFKVSAHIGLVETEQAKDKRQHLLDVWRGKMEAESAFCVNSAVEADDEWLHSFYYFNDDIPTESDFQKTVRSFLSFEFSQIVGNNSCLFDSMPRPALSKSADLPDLPDLPDLGEVRWEELLVRNIFTDIQRGKRLIKDHQIEGGIPYISSTAMNNGVDNFIGNDENVRQFENCLTIANSGSVGSTFFHPYRFIASDHVTHLKNELFTPHIYLFLATMLSRLSGKYNFNREINDKRISREKVMLPVTDEGEIHLAYMENYMQILDRKTRSLYQAYSKDG